MRTTLIVDDGDRPRLTSARVDLWRHGNTRLARLLEGNQAVALGRITPCVDVLQRLTKLQAPRVKQHGEVLAPIERVSLPT